MIDHKNIKQLFESAANWSWEAECKGLSNVERHKKWYEHLVASRDRTDKLVREIEKRNEERANKDASS